MVSSTEYAHVWLHTLIIGPQAVQGDLPMSVGGLGLTMQLCEPYLQVIQIQRWLCRDAVVVVFLVENGARFVILTPYN
mgnify:CR=1 FL=1